MAEGVTSLVIDPLRPTTVYAGLSSPFDGGKWTGKTAYRRSVYKTTNGGKTWRALHLIGQPVGISPTGPPTIYAAAGGPGGTSRLLRSGDGGTWHEADRGLPPTFVWALAFDPTTPRTVYAAMGERGIFKSGDGGTTWGTVRLRAAFRTVTAIAVDPNHPQTIYAGTPNGLIKSLDGGHSWGMANAAMAGHNRDRGYKEVTALLVDSRDSRTVYATTGCAGVFKSTDAGHTWASANAGLEPNCSWTYALALDPRNSQMYAADHVRGIVKSLDGGARWQAVNNGLSLSGVNSIAVAPQSPRMVYAAAGRLGLFTSSDMGAHWRSLPSAPRLVEGFALDPSNPRNLLVIAAAYGVVRTTDAGRTWRQARLGAVSRKVTAVAISGKTAYAGTGGKGVFGSTDGGRSWRPLGPSGAVFVQAIAISPVDPLIVYATSFGSNARGLYKSTNGGSSWQQLTDALDVDVDAVALDPKDPATIYIGTPGGEKGLLKSTDGGATWQSASSGLPLEPATSYTGKQTKITVGVNAVAIDPAHPRTLYVATAYRGVFQSTNSGDSWHPFNNGLADLNVGSLAIDATGRTLYAGTGGGGVVTLHRRA